jgi:hypothetical protein
VPLDSTKNHFIEPYGYSSYNFDYKSPPRIRGRSVNRAFERTRPPVFAAGGRHCLTGPGLFRHTDLLTERILQPLRIVAVIGCEFILEYERTTRRKWIVGPFSATVLYSEPLPPPCRAIGRCFWTCMRRWRSWSGSISRSGRCCGGRMIYFNSRTTGPADPRLGKSGSAYTHPRKSLREAAAGRLPGQSGARTGANPAAISEAPRAESSAAGISGTSPIASECKICKMPDLKIRLMINVDFP